MERTKNLSHSRDNCCVVGGHNAYYNTDTTVKFYSFPGKGYEAERKQIWINRVRRASESNKLWQPKKHHRICSVHFAGNRKSNNPRHPSYNPTIFPKEYKKSVTSQQLERFQRVVNRSAGTFTLAVKEHEEQPSADEVTAETPEKENVSCQTDFEVLGDSTFTFICDFNNDCEKSVQVNVPCIRRPLFIRVDDKCVGNSDILECNGFHGYRSIKTDKDLNSLAGVMFDRFTLLLSFLLVNHGNSRLTTENKLLLFLMKMKLGLSNSALAVLFAVHHTTCSRIFISVLNELVQKTKKIVFWPSRNVINFTMPQQFKIHYPECRSIIDCSEIKVQRPSRIDERIYIYSQYKSTFTAKFLIAIAPSGFVSFVSQCYGGRSTDAFITNDCGFLELLENGDVILADKGFPGIKCKDNVILVIPPFVHEGRLDPEEVEETYNIATVRIHVERSIQRIKVYKILDVISYNLFPYVGSIVRMCCVLANLQPPTIHEYPDED